MHRKPFQWDAWWYTAIAAGFALLAIHRAMIGERPLLIAVRLVIAAGFATVAALTFRQRS